MFQTTTSNRYITGLIRIIAEKDKCIKQLKQNVKDHKHTQSHSQIHHDILENSLSIKAILEKVSLLESKITHLTNELNKEAALNQQYQSTISSLQSKLHQQQTSSYQLNQELLREQKKNTKLQTINAYLKKQLQFHKNASHKLQQKLQTQANINTICSRLTRKGILNQEPPSQYTEKTQQSLPINILTQSCPSNFNNQQCQIDFTIANLSIISNGVQPKCNIDNTFTQSTNQQQSPRSMHCCQTTFGHPEQKAQQGNAGQELLDMVLSID